MTAPRPGWAIRPSLVCPTVACYFKPYSRDQQRLRSSLWIYDLRFSLAGHGRLISFFRHIGEESNPHRRFAALGHCVRSALVPSLAATPRSRYTPFGVPENMSKRELKALQVAPVPASPPADQPEPEAEAEDDQVAAEAARLQRVQEQIEAELTRARESVKSFAEAFVEPSASAGSLPRGVCRPGAVSLPGRATRCIYYKHSNGQRMASY